MPQRWTTWPPRAWLISHHYPISAPLSGFFAFCPLLYCHRYLNATSCLLTADWRSCWRTDGDCLWHPSPHPFPIFHSNSTRGIGNHGRKDTVYLQWVTARVSLDLFREAVTRISKRGSCSRATILGQNHICTSGILSKLDYRNYSSLKQLWERGNDFLVSLISSSNVMLAWLYWLFVPDLIILSTLNLELGERERGLKGV